jgi:hypothetical protein
VKLLLSIHPIPKKPGHKPEPISIKNLPQRKEQNPTASAAIRHVSAQLDLRRNEHAFPERHETNSPGKYVPFSALILTRYAEFTQEAVEIKM